MGQRHSGALSLCACRCAPSLLAAFNQISSLLILYRRNIESVLCPEIAIAPVVLTRPPKDSVRRSTGDRSQYGSDEFQRVLDGFGMVPSMSRKGKCRDNACAETVFGSMKVERLAGQAFSTRRAAQNDALAWIRWYNPTRMHSTVGYLRTSQFEMSSSDAEQKNGCWKVEKQKTFFNFPTATTATGLT